MSDEPIQIPKSINFDYVKSSQFRVLHADGAFLSVNFQGGVVLSFFAERQPIPRRIVHPVNPDGTLGDEIVEQRVVRDAIIRDTDVAVSMSLDSAKRIHAALSDLFGKIEEAQAKDKKEKRG